MDQARNLLPTRLRDLEQDDILIRQVIRQKPLHVEYMLSAKGKSIIPILKNIEGLSG